VSVGGRRAPAGVEFADPEPDRWDEDADEVRFTGRLAREPEHQVHDGLEVCDLLVVCRRRRAHQGATVLKPVKIDVKAVGETARFCCRALRKGSRVVVEGELDCFEHRNRQGADARLGVVAHQVQRA
jgi:single-stranded DNA-binding protein